MEDGLSPKDVARLIADPNARVRADIAEKVAAQHPLLSDAERKLAEDVFRIMVRDAEVRVRQALSLQLKSNPLIPHDVALALARDVDAVALPILQFSEVLSDEDLIAIVRSHGPRKREAVAKRGHVSAPVADAVVNTKDEKAVATLVANQGAELTDDTLKRVADDMAGSDVIGMALASRGGLPVTVAESLMNRISENLRSTLLGRSDLPDDVASALLVQARERAVLGLSNTETDAVKLVSHLHRKGRLTASIVLRAVCMGDVTFFEAALAKLGQVDLDTGRRLIGAGRDGFRSLFERAGLPSVFLQAMWAAVDVSRTMQYDGGPRDRERFSRRVIERVLTQYGDLGVEFETSDLEYLMARMNQLPATGEQQPDNAAG